MRGYGAVIAVVALTAIALASWTMYLGMRGTWERAALDTPVQRGRLVAESMGCFGCHGPGGGQPIPNPGAKGGEVPGWTGGTWMMWSKDERDIRAWILKGRPEHREPDTGALIKMPAYAGRIPSKDIDDLVAFVLAASHFGPIPDEAASAGHEAAYRLGCFGCHGPEGRGLVMNPGSFTGFIPPWDSRDFAELVKDDAEFQQWVRDGMCVRLRDNPVARKLLETQTIAMPAYRDRVSETDLRTIAAYVAWVRAHPRIGSPAAATP